jgi:hypothetical protein
MRGVEAYEIGGGGARGWEGGEGVAAGRGWAVPPAKMVGCGTVDHTDFPMNCSCGRKVIVRIPSQTLADGIPLLPQSVFCSSCKKLRDQQASSAHSSGSSSDSLRRRTETCTLFARAITTLYGDTFLHYQCPQCRTALRNPLSEAGNADSCPRCGADFVVPFPDSRTPSPRSGMPAITLVAIGAVLALIIVFVTVMLSDALTANPSAERALPSQGSTVSSTFTQPTVPSARDMYTWCQRRWKRADREGRPIEEFGDAMFQLAGEHFYITSAEAKDLYLEGARQWVRSPWQY